MPERWMWDDRPKGEPTLSWDEGEASGPLAIGTMLMRVSDHEAQVEALQAEVERLREALDDIEQVYAVRDGHLPTATCLHGEERYPWCPRCIARAALSPQPEERSK